MIRLTAGGQPIAALTEPEWLDLSTRFSGLRLRVRPLTALRQGMAQSLADAAVRQLSQGLASLADYGLDGPGPDGQALDIRNAAQMRAVGQLIQLVELALQGVEAVEGLDMAGPGVLPGAGFADQPVGVRRQALSLLCQDGEIGLRMLEHLQRMTRIVVPRPDPGPEGGNEGNA